MDTRLKPIPAFYCCYLLRSTVRPSSVYIGSTPHPARRLAQHNGRVTGGAVRTSRLSLRPWDMVCIVAGFPSNIAALQFEWAWQNAHLTRHISPDERISFPTSRIKTNSKTGKTRRKLGRPRTSMGDKLSNLHLLLRAPYFSGWPLELRFFNQSAFEFWQSWCSRSDGEIRQDIPIILDLKQALPEEEEFSSAQRQSKPRKIDLIGKGGVEGVDPTYAKYRVVTEKSLLQADETPNPQCNTCFSSIDFTKDLWVICPEHLCQSTAHATCLSKRFLQEAHSTQMIPSHGSCPACKTDLKWPDLMRAMSLRIRGEKEVRKLLNKTRRGKLAVAAEILETSDEDMNTDGEDHVDVEVEDLDEELGSDTEDLMSVTSLDSIGSSHPVHAKPQKDEDRLEIVIEDSEDDR